MAKRLGLARAAALIEDLKRELSLGSSGISCTSVTASTAIESAGTLSTTGNTTLSGNVKGTIGLKSATISATSGTTWSSGAISIPANSIISELGVVVSAEVTLADAGTVSVKFGTSAAGAQFVANTAYQGSSDTHDVGKGTSTEPVALPTAMGATAQLVFVAGTPFSTSAREVHGTVTAGGTIEAGTMKFWVKYHELG